MCCATIVSLAWTTFPWHSNSHLRRKLVASSIFCRRKWSTSSQQVPSLATVPLLTFVTAENVTQNFHVSGVTPEMHRSTPALSSFYDTLSVNHDKNGKVFISTMEAKDWPIYATQWHPERPEVCNHEITSQRL